MQFEMLRLSLVERQQRHLFGPAEGEGLDREAWLRRIFGQEIDFTHRSGRFHFLWNRCEIITRPRA
jgi:hypothetical protein